MKPVLPKRMMNLSTKLAEGLNDFSLAVESLLTAETYLIGGAHPPEEPGVYAFLIDGQVVYVGEAKGSGGLRDRILKKHMAGDESHALQRYFKDQLPDRQVRRNHIKSNVQVKWVVVRNPELVPVVERMAIWLLNPRLNRA